MHDQQLDMMGMDEVDLDTILANLDQMESDPRPQPERSRGGANESVIQDYLDAYGHAVKWRKSGRKS